MVNEAGDALPGDATGEIVGRGETVMSAHWRNPEATSKSLRHGWLWTGDMGALDGYGFTTLKERSNDLISGCRVPRERHTASPHLE